MVNIPRRTDLNGPWDTTRHGITLLELLVVLAIMGLMAGMAVMQLKQPYRTARLGDAVSRTMLMDQQARDHARRFACSARIIYDLDKNWAYVESGNTSHQECFRLALPSGVRLDQFRTDVGQTDHGPCTVELPASGQSTSYAVRLCTGKETGRWLFFTGYTGQMTELPTENDVKKVFELLCPPRAHVD